MKRGWMAVGLACVSGVVASMSWSDEINVRTLDAQTGRIGIESSFSDTNLGYRTQWAMTPEGPWSDYGDAGRKPEGTGLTNAIPAGPSSVCFRVIATTN